MKLASDLNPCFKETKLTKFQESTMLKCYDTNKFTLKCYDTNRFAYFFPNYLLMNLYVNDIRDKMLKQNEVALQFASPNRSNDMNAIFLEKV